jgi:hypothetical protein
MMNIENQAIVNEVALEITETHHRFSNHEIKSVQHSQIRLIAIKRVLQAIADGFEFPAIISHCDSNGEYEFFGNKGRKDAPCKPFGEKLAALLSQVETRTGIVPSKSPVYHLNGWTRISHFEAEKLIFLMAE